MNNPIHYLWLVFISITLSGCKADQGSLKARLAYSIENEEKHLESGSHSDYPWHWTESGKHLLHALKKADRDSLKTPTLAVALCLQKKASTSLVVRWIEDKPSVEAVGIRSPSLDEPMTIEISDDYQRENEDISQKAVTYRAVFTWQGQTSPKILNEDDCEVYLLVDGEEVSKKKLLRQENE